MKRPNVIVCLCDQLRAFEVGCYGNSVIQTPHLDRLAANGLRFETAVTNNPVCMPARSCLLSGQFSRTCMGDVSNIGGDPPSSHRLHFPNRTLAEQLKSAGYRTSLIGKWHIEVQPELLGFDEAIYPLAIHRYGQQRYFNKGQLGAPTTQFAPDFEIEQVEKFLETKRTDPFFLFYNISLPHEPIGPGELPEKYLRMYDRHKMPLRLNVFQNGQMAHSDFWFKIYRSWDYFWRMAKTDCWRPCEGYPCAGVGELPADQLPDGFDLRDLTALYYGATTLVDDLVGRMMRCLQQQGLADDTLVIFLSDHGDNLGSHQLFNKDCLYEESIRIPMIMHHPRRLQPRVNGKQIAQIIDLMPTILDWVGAPMPDNMQGQSLSAILHGQADSLPRNHAFIETDTLFFKRPVIGIRTPTHLYGVRLDENWDQMEEKPWGFFDLRDDPFEQNSLAERPNQSDLADDLHQQLRDWNARTPWLAPM